ncbi:prepilin-type N-terminal cleavage/methylation domain-containing protein [Clostridium lundense]|uniref:prepilin-type N-terminal cleavage/methylation domain-containing protein n=1 Tax=Clostridium lundense TaxID=319475 RepID=UPI000A00B7B6
MKNKKKGFTLVELLVVIAIIAILAAIIAPNAFKAIEKSKVATAESDYKAIKTAALSYYSDMGTWPNDKNKGGDPGFMENNSDKDNKINWNGPYLEKWPTKNPWGGEYYFIVTKDLNTTNLKLENGTKVLKLNNVNSNAINRLEADLDGDKNGKEGIVRYDANNIVYLIISEQQ